ncbi:MAG TPA: glutamate--tRNA ligase [Chthoniobacteraceae bacterium]|nr:glutamate--tRNA ligase [Chthoniobacteraceae bacterium]
MSSNVRVRFAPSPTGYLHVGGARTALFNWLFARHTGGKMILRIEDTDKARNTEEATAAIYDGLRWLGLEWDEGPFVGGEYGPYFQSEREEIYLRYFERLRDAGHLYEDNGAWRFRSPRKTVVLQDLTCGKIAFDLSSAATHPDITIRRPDGGWIFHFVNVVDDIEMKITHVIRGEDHLSNTPKHLELYEALGAEPPQFAHIPLILNRDGSKMSKRDQGAAIAGYKEQGYAPEAVRNYLCLLGWSPKDNREILDISEIISLFELTGINRRNASFDLDKCFWINGQYLLAMSLERFAELSLPYIDAAGIAYGSREALLPVLAIVKEKIKRLNEVPGWIAYFFTDEVEFDEAAVEKNLRKAGAAGRLTALAERYEALESWDAATLETTLKETAAALGAKTGELIHPTRTAVSGRAVGPSLYPMLEVLGKDRVVARMRAAAAQKAAA